MKYLLFLLSCFVCCGILSAQDLITTKDGDDIQGKVVEITQEVIKYRKSDNPDGPLYTLDKSEIFMITYENGTKDVFTTLDRSDKMTNEQSATLYFYRPKKFAGGKPKIIVGTAVPDEVVVALKNGRWYKKDYTHIGERQFVTGVYSLNPEIYTLEIDPGGVYYFRCTVLSKGLKLMAEMELVSKQTAQGEMAELKEQTEDMVKSK